MKNVRGFTLVELMVTMAVAAVLLSLAVPSFTEMIRNNRMTAQANDLITALNLARSESFKRGTQVQVAASGGAWANGWNVQLTEATVLRTFSAISSGYTLTEGGDLTTLTYDSTGRVTAAANFTLCDSQRSGETGRTISILITGRVSVTNFSCP